MKYQFSEGDGVVCKSPSEVNELLTRAMSNGYPMYSFSTAYKSFVLINGVFILCEPEAIKRQITPSDFTALVQGKLPKYWCFDMREKDSKKALKCLDNKYKTEWADNDFAHRYYGYEGVHIAFSGTNAFDSISKFQNSPFLLPVQYILDAAVAENIEKENIKKYPLSPCECFKPHTWISEMEIMQYDKVRGRLNKIFIDAFELNHNKIKTMNITREQFIKHWKEIEAWKNGAEIQYKNNILKTWTDIKNPDWVYDTEYRIKPQPKYVPFDITDSDFLRSVWVRIKSENTIWAILGIGTTYIAVQGKLFSYKEALEKLEFIDGTPFGKLSKYI